MTLPTGENPISFSQIRTEFGDGTNTATSPVRLGQDRATDPSFTNESLIGKYVFDRYFIS